VHRRKQAVLGCKPAVLGCKPAVLGCKPAQHQRFRLVRPARAVVNKRRWKAPP